MTITIDAKALHQGLAKLRTAIRPTKLYPVLNCVRMECVAGRLSLGGFDLDHEMIVALDCAGDMTATITPMAQLADWLSNCLSRGEASIDIDGAAIVVKAGRARAKFPTLPLEQWAQFSPLKPSASFSISGSALSAAISAVLPSIKEDVARADLAGLSIDTGGIWDETGVLTLCGSNGVMLSAREVTPAKIKGKVKAILAKPAAQSIARLIAGEEIVDISFDESAVLIAGTNFTYRAKLVAATYRDWRRLTPKPIPQVSYDTTQFAAAMAVAGAGASTEGPRRAVPVKLCIGDEGTTSFDGSDKISGAVSSDECPHLLLADPLAKEFILASDQSLDLVKGLDCETVEFMLNKNGDGLMALITAAGLSDRVACTVVMRG